MHDLRKCHQFAQFLMIGRACWGDGLENSVRFPHLISAPDIFSGLSETFASRFLDRCAARSYVEGDIVLAQGDPVTEMFLVAHGLIEITSSGPRGQDVLVTVQRQAETFGEIEAIADQPAAATCMAAKTSVLLSVPRGLLLEAAADPTFLRNLFRSSYGRLKRDNEAKFVDQYYPVDRRLAYYLHQLSADRPEIARTQSELSELLGCARQTLNKELKRLREKGVLDHQKGKIVILDRDALQDLASKTLVPA